MRYLLSFSLLLLLSCSTSRKTADARGAKKPASSLKGTSWTLSTIPDFKMETLKNPVMLNFNDSTNRMGGYSGCNGFGGEYVVNGTELKMDHILGTMRACMPGMKTESRLYDILKKTDHYRISGDKLVLLQGNAVLAEFAPAKKDQK